jgi:FlaA1/EpsC-like NDP-sugar epimerase
MHQHLSTHISQIKKWVIFAKRSMTLNLTKAPFSGRNVFITGGTGFLGCVLIYKLLKFCPDVGSIYLLIRDPINKSPN